MSRRVVITGLGVITPLGENADTLWENICAGKSGIGPITRFDMSAFNVRFGGECTHFDPTNHGIDGREAKRMDRFSIFGLAASKGALADSGLDLDREDRHRIGVIIGSGIGGLETLEEQHEIMMQKGPSRVSPFTVPRLMVNAASGNVSIALGLKGPATAVATACATGANAIGDATRMIQHGGVDVMFAGGAEAALCRLGMASFQAARALSHNNDNPQQASRPWDKNRDGFVMSEGAGVVILEEMEHAKARGARIYCEVGGYGMTADAHHITAIVEDGSTPALAMELALKDAGVNRDDVDYINAHGTSTPVGDPAEVKAIKRCFGDAAKKLVLSSTKSMLGHSLGATGGVETVITALSVYNNLVPPTINLDEPDLEAGCDLDFTPHKAKDLKVDIALNNSFGFGGHNACLLLKKFA